ncbi:MAG: pentapeptide repeat-containing protein [Actinopolymorphaceae bacterium]
MEDVLPDRAVLLDVDRLQSLSGDPRNLGARVVDPDVVFDQCRMDLSTFRFTSFTKVRFSGCNLTQADFTDADLRGALFVDCNLTGVQFAQADMSGTRPPNCILDGEVRRSRGCAVVPTRGRGRSYGERSRPA